jgi:hypothetical protein
MKNKKIILEKFRGLKSFENFILIDEITNNIDMSKDMIDLMHDRINLQVKIIDNSCKNGLS